MLSTANGRFAAIARTSISGSSVLRSTSTNAIRMSTPAAIEPIVAGSPQPQTVDCWIPSTDKPIPATINTAPRMSMREGCFVSARWTR
jgi:hypothetical protein